MMSFTSVVSLYGLVALTAVASPVLAKPEPIEIALTFDDLPAHSALPPGQTRVGIAEQILAALHEAGAPSVYGFVNAVQEEREPESAAVLGLWRAAGHPLGNHTWSHMALSKNSLANWQADLIRNEPVLEKQMAGADWRWLRFPFLDEGDTPEKRDAARQFLAQHHYRIASVTMSFDDWAWNEPYARCVAKGDTAAITALETSYLKAAKDSFNYSRAMAHSLYGKDIPYVLLMHEGALDARLLPRLLAFYQSQGARLVTLDTAERHPFYAADFSSAPTTASVTLENAMVARGLRVPIKTWDVQALSTVCG